MTQPRICIVISPYYQDIAAELLRGATAQLEVAGAAYDVINVPGAFEIPSAVRLAVASGKYDAYVALGCVIRGETSHYDYVCGESARGLNQIALKYQAPIGYGILTVDNPEQAWVRAAVAQGNKGSEAVIACLTLLAIKQQLGVA